MGTAARLARMVEHARQIDEEGERQESSPFDYYEANGRVISMDEVMANIPDEVKERLHERLIKVYPAEVSQRTLIDSTEAAFFAPITQPPLQAEKNMIDSLEDLSSEPITQPPINAEFLLHLLLRHDEQDAIIGDLIERYGKKCARLGTRRTNIWFYAEIFWTALPLIKRALLKVSGMVTLAEFVRRHIS